MGCPCGRTHAPQGPGLSLLAEVGSFCGPQCRGREGRRRCNACLNPDRTLSLDGRCTPCAIRDVEAHSACLSASPPVTGGCPELLRDSVATYPCNQGYLTGVCTRHGRFRG